MAARSRCVLTLAALLVARHVKCWRQEANATQRTDQSFDTSAEGLDGTGSPIEQQFDTLLLYLYADTDRHYKRNLEFFIEHGSNAGSSAAHINYVIIVNAKGAGAATAVLGLPDLPANARYVVHEDSGGCFDWGAYAWALAEVEDPRQYKYLMFLNSSVRGPYLPAYWPGTRHWTTAFINRLNDDTKLVGATISCGRTHRNNDPAQPHRSNPHVQSYVMATDQVGLAIWNRTGDVLRCHGNMLDTIWHSELGASAAVLEAGYNLDCLMVKYQGVDWRNASFHQCNGRVNPMWEGQYDGLSLNPLEQMFVKVKEQCIEQDLCATTASMAVQYDEFASKAGALNTVVANAAFDTPQGTLDIGTDAWGADDDAALASAMECFDIDFYRANNKDITHMDRQAAMAHFGEHGRHELQRPWRIISSDACSVTVSIDRMSPQHTANVSLGTFSNADVRQ